MFERLTQALHAAVSKLTGKAQLTESELSQLKSTLRAQLIDADVAVAAINEVLASLEIEPLTRLLSQGLTAKQAVLKSLYDSLKAALGEVNTHLNLNRKDAQPAIIMLVGQQGAGKTTTAAKLAHYLKAKKKKVLLASLDNVRYAAQAQLAVLANQLSIPFMEAPTPLPSFDALAKQALEAAVSQGAEVLILDTAGRLKDQAELMLPLQHLQQRYRPTETLLVVDAMTGQIASNIAKQFSEAIQLSGVILTKLDGDAKGGAALSVRSGAPIPIKFIGVGEKTDALAAFHPERMAARILGMGDIASLFDAIKEHEKKEEQAYLEKVAKGRAKFDLNAMLIQLKQVQALGGVGAVVDKLPMALQMQHSAQLAHLSPQLIPQMIAMILSMTPKERAMPELLKASRKKRIAAGSGVSVQSVNQLLKQADQLKEGMQWMQKLGMSGMMKQLGGMLKGGFKW